MIISSKSIHVEFMCFGIIFEKCPFAIFSFYTFFQNVFVLGYSFFQTNKVEVIRFSKNVYIWEKRLKKTHV